MKSRKRFFIFGVKERMRVINKLETLLRRECDVKLWHRDVFPPGSFSWEAVEKAIRAADFAVLVISVRILAARVTGSGSSKDNVILEAGLALVSSDASAHFWRTVRQRAQGSHGLVGLRTYLTG